MELIGKFKNKLTLADGKWKNNKVSYWVLKCLGTVKVNSIEKTNLEALCNGFDNSDCKFSIKLIRKSVYDIGFAENIYIR